MVCLQAYTGTKAPFFDWGQGNHLVLTRLFFFLKKTQNSSPQFSHCKYSMWKCLWHSLISWMIRNVPQPYHRQFHPKNMSLDIIQNNDLKGVCRRPVANDGTTISVPFHHCQFTVTTLKIGRVPIGQTMPWLNIGHWDSRPSNGPQSDIDVERPITRAASLK